MKINALAIGHFYGTDGDDRLGAITKESEDLIVNSIDV
jgi:hypothetical protein